MKTIKFFILILFLIITIHSCNKTNDEVFVDQGYIIGFNPCKKGAPIVPNDSIRGLLVEISDKTSDTLLTYNLPWALFDFPDSLFEGYRFNYYFPEHSKEIYKVKLTYRYAKPDEKLLFACVGDILALGFEKLIDKQIIILSAEAIN